jgi:hypothetical protein
MSLSSIIQDFTGCPLKVKSPHEKPTITKSCSKTQNIPIAEQLYLCDEKKIFSQFENV